ncbi:MAG: RagB/SusD family nutrient uptake outer membrane protein [Bacteroidales bacterium]|jgi:hypothetical protein|nr:RagB/SusD family nutrient uptake outer membrane protein [Bacteroidales bacterium]
MKRIIQYMWVCSAIIALVSCKGYLDTSSPSKFENDFIFASEQSTMSALLNVYTKARAGDCLSDRIVMNLNGVGSDIEVRPDFTTSGRGAVINLYPSGATEWNNSDASVRQWTSSYTAINAANEVIEGIEATRPEVLTATEPSNITQMYGEAFLLRAVLYWELVRNFGDVPLMVKASKAGMSFAIPVTHRWEVLDQMLTDLERIAPLMMWADEIPQGAERVSRGFCYAMIANIALTRAGYSLHPDPNDPAAWGTVKRDDTNLRKYYEQANTALKKLVAGGRHALITNDTRTNIADKGVFGNPFQQVFQDQMDYKISKESLWEVSMARDDGGNWGYAYARAHTGANNTNVSKAYGAIRFTPTYYYSFDAADLRRDVTAAVTGTNGNGQELMLTPGTVGDGGLNGISLNKWDKMRMDNPYNQGNGRAGINFVYMRYADALLLLAETEAVLNNGGGDAKTYLKMVRNRAFRSEDRPVKVEQYVDGLSGDAVLQAIKQERAWELAGENVRKHDLIRWGEFNHAIIDARKALQQMANDIRSQRYHVYPNGMEIADSVYVKQLKPAAFGTTYGTPPGNTNPLLAPGWRGVGDEGKGFPVAAASYMLAIKGLDKHLSDTEKADLKSQGYKAAPWGVTFLGAGNTYSSYIGNGRGNGMWGGYMEEDLTAGKPARYLCPIPGSVITATGKDEHGNNILVNYYGFMNEP